MATAPESYCGGTAPHARHYHHLAGGPALCPGLGKGETPPPAPVEEAVAPATGVPVVDLGLLVRQLLESAEESRTRAHDLVTLTASLAAQAASQRRQADFLEALAATLDGRG